jgi:hypothetical protein
MTVQFVGVTEQGRMTRKAPAQAELRPTCAGARPRRPPPPPPPPPPPRPPPPPPPPPRGPPAWPHLRARVLQNKLTLMETRPTRHRELLQKLIRRPPVTAFES